MSERAPGDGYHLTQESVMAAIGAGFDAGLGHAALVEILRDLADDLENGTFARDPYGPFDSRRVDARATAEASASANIGQLRVHLVVGEAGELDTHATWVHSAHASIADAKAVAERLSRMAGAAREAAGTEQQAAVRRLIEADDRHPAAGLLLEETVSFAHSYLFEPGTYYTIDTRQLQFGRLREEENSDGPPSNALTPENLTLGQDLPPGWHTLYRELLSALPAGTRLDYAVEKLGTMVAWSYRPPSGASEIFLEYRAKSSSICAQCGELGAMSVRRGHCMAYCPEHARRFGYEPPAPRARPTDQRE